MYIAIQKKKDNIVEYLLYMWQIEDLIRSCNFDMDILEKKVIDPMAKTDMEFGEIYNWYSKIVDIMKKEGLKETGHMSDLNFVLAELNFLHKSLLNVFQDKKYIKLYTASSDHIRDLGKRTDESVGSEVEACLGAMYGWLMLRLQKKTISKQTHQSIQHISKLMNYLADSYKKLKTGKLKLPEIHKN